MESSQKSKLKGKKARKFQTESQAYLWIIKNQRTYIHIGDIDVEGKYKKKNELCSKRDAL